MATLLLFLWSQVKSVILNETIRAWGSMPNVLTEISLRLMMQPATWLVMESLGAPPTEKQTQWIGSPSCVNNEVHKVSPGKIFRKKGRSGSKPLRAAVSMVYWTWRKICRWWEVKVTRDEKLRSFRSSNNGANSSVETDIHGLIQLISPSTFRHWSRV